MQEPQDSSSPWSALQSPSNSTGSSQPSPVRDRRTPSGDSTPRSSVELPARRPLDKERALDQDERGRQRSGDRVDRVEKNRRGGRSGSDDDSDLEHAKARARESHSRRQNGEDRDPHRSRRNRSKPEPDAKSGAGRDRDAGRGTRDVDRDQRRDTEREPRRDRDKHERERGKDRGQQSDRERQEWGVRGRPRGERDEDREVKMGSDERREERSGRSDGRYRQDRDRELGGGHDREYEQRGRDGDRHRGRDRDRGMDRKRDRDRERDKDRDREWDRDRRDRNSRDDDRGKGRYVDERPAPQQSRERHGDAGVSHHRSDALPPPPPRAKLGRPPRPPSPRAGSRRSRSPSPGIADDWHRQAMARGENGRRYPHHRPSGYESDEELRQLRSSNFTEYRRKKRLRLLEKQAQLIWEVTPSPPPDEKQEEEWRRQREQEQRENAASQPRGYRPADDDNPETLGLEGPPAEQDPDDVEDGPRHRQQQQEALLFTEWLEERKRQEAEAERLAREQAEADAFVGPKPPPGSNQNRQAAIGYGGALLPGEGDRMAAYVQSGKRIPRRGEVGLSAGEISKFEELGYIMSGSRHSRMNAIRIRKENQVYSAEEKAALAMFNAEENKRKEHKILANMKALVDRTIGKTDDGGADDEGPNDPV